MKIKNPDLIITITVICCIVLTAVLWFFSAKAEATIVQWSTPPPDLTLAPGENIPDTIQYSKYLQFKDSIETTRYLKNGEAGDLEGVSLKNVIGTGYGLMCDTCTLKWYHLNNISTDKEHKQYYIDLLGWRIRNTESDYLTNSFVRFYVKNNQSYIHQSDIDILVKFRYNHKGQFLMIPVSEFTKKTFNIVLTIFWIIIGLYILYVIVCFIHFLTDLSKGLVFTDINLQRLLIISISLLAYPILILLLNLLMRLIFMDYFTKDVVLNMNIFKGLWEDTAEGIVFLLIYKAFRKGKFLQDEQELTV